MEKLLSASEIASLKLPGLPTTRAAVNVMAKREGWEFDTVTGIGGTRRVFRVPAKYLGSVETQETGSATSGVGEVKSGAIAGTVAAGSSRVDIRKLELAIQALNEWEATRNMSIPADRRPAVIAVLYDFLVKSEGGETQGMDVVLRALG